MLIDDSVAWQLFSGVKPRAVVEGHAPKMQEHWDDVVTAGVPAPAGTTTGGVVAPPGGAAGAPLQDWVRPSNSTDVAPVQKEQQAPKLSWLDDDPFGQPHIPPPVEVVGEAVGEMAPWTSAQLPPI